MSEQKRSAWKRLLVSETLFGKNKSHKIAYIAVMTALNVIVAAYKIPLGFTQFSLKIFMSVLTGVIIGPIFGFSAGFIGDILGYIVGYGGANGWTPWIGLATSMMALISGFVMNGCKWKFRRAWILKISIVCLLTFLISTVCINTTAMYLIWYKDSFPSWINFLIVRLFIEGQIWNSVVNYVLLFIAFPVLSKIKALKIRI